MTARPSRPPSTTSAVRLRVGRKIAVAVLAAVVSSLVPSSAAASTPPEVTAAPSGPTTPERAESDRPAGAGAGVAAPGGVPLGHQAGRSPWEVAVHAAADLEAALREAERLEAERLEAERAAAEQRAAEERAALEARRIEAERAAAQRRENEKRRAAQQAAARLAPHAAADGQDLAAPEHHSDGGDMWAALRQCESRGDYGAVSKSGKYRGAYQFSQRTWDSVASRHRPDLVGVDPAAAAPADQDAMARALYETAGRGQWPHCGPRTLR